MKKIKIKEIINKNKITLLGAFVGGISGWLYWYFIGCNSGTCAITSNPYNSMLYGMVLGGILFSMFEIKPKKENNIKKIDGDKVE